MANLRVIPVMIVLLLRGSGCQFHASRLTAVSVQLAPEMQRTGSDTPDRAPNPSARLDERNLRDTDKRQQAVGISDG